MLVSSGNLSDEVDEVRNIVVMPDICTVLGTIHATHLCVCVPQPFQYFYLRVNRECACADTVRY